MSTKNKRRSTNINVLIEFQKKIIDFLENSNLNILQTDSSNEIVLKAFPDLNSQTKIVFNELIENINTNPQFIVDVAKEFSNNKEILTKLIISGIKQKKYNNTSTIETIEKISNLYELTTILKYPAYLLSRQKTNYNNLNTPSSILKYFNKFGLSKNCINNLRLIRNADSHKFTINEDKIILEDNSSLNALEIENLYNNYNNIITWWITLSFTILFSLPKFSLLVTIGIYASLSNNKEDWEKFGKGFKHFFKDQLNDEDRSKHKKITFSKKVLKKSKNIYIKYKKYLIKRFRPKEKENTSKVNASVLVNKLKIILNLLGDEISNISKMLTNDYDKKNLDKIAIWLLNPKNILHKLIDSFEHDPETFLLILKKKVNKL